MGPAPRSRAPRAGPGQPEPLQKSDAPQPSFRVKVLRILRVVRVKPTISGWSLFYAILLWAVWFSCLTAVVYSCTGDWALGLCVSLAVPQVVSDFSQTNDKLGLALSFFICYWVGYTIRRRVEVRPIIMLTPLQDVVVKHAIEMDHSPAPETPADNAEGPELTV